MHKKPAQKFTREELEQLLAKHPERVKATLEWPKDLFLAYKGYGKAVGKLLVANEEMLKLYVQKQMSRKETRELMQFFLDKYNIKFDD